MSEPKSYLEQWWRLFAWILISLAAVWFIARIYITMLVFGLACLIAYLLYPVVKKVTTWRYPFSRKTWSLPIAIAFIYIVLTSVIILSITFAGPSIKNQAVMLANSLPQHFSQAQTIYNKFQDYLNAKNISPTLKEQLQANFNQIATTFGAFISNIVKQLGLFILNLISWLFYLFTALLISIFILAQIQTLKSNFFTYLPPKYRTGINNLLLEIHEIFGGFLKGSIYLSLINGILTFIALSLYGFFTQPYQYNLTASLIAALTYAIPIVGILISSLLGGLLAFAQTSTLSYGLSVFIIMFVINKIVDQFIVPKVMSDAIGVSPLFIIFAAFAGGECLGFLGMILGVPIAAMVKAIATYLYKNFLEEKAQKEETHAG